MYFEAFVERTEQPRYRSQRIRCVREIDVHIDKDGEGLGENHLQIGIYKDGLSESLQGLFRDV